jgi:small subunit ribosomal protein S16
LLRESKKKFSQFVVRLPNFSREIALQPGFLSIRSPLFLRRGGAAGYIDFMAVRIRMKRIGAKNTPVFRIVVADSRSPRDGKFIEELGTYQPLQKGNNFTLNLDRAKYWVEKGAQPSDTVASFIKKAGRAAANTAA